MYIRTQRSTISMAAAQLQLQLQLLLVLALLALAPSLRRGITNTVVHQASVSPSRKLLLYATAAVSSPPLLTKGQRILFVEDKLDRLDNAMIKLITDCARAEQRYRCKLAGSSSSSSSISTGPLLSSTESWDGLYAVTAGLDAWSEALARGCLPYSDVIVDYDAAVEELYDERGIIGSGVDTAGITFPEARLCRHMCRTFQALDLPRLTGAHPEVIPAVLRALLQITSSYYSDMRLKVERREDRARASAEECIDWETYNDTPPTVEGEQEEATAEEEHREIIASAARRFELAWGPAVGSVNLLDSLFGSKHRLLNSAATAAAADDLHSFRHEQRGYSIFDGVWSDSGWKVMSDLQTQIEQMEDLQRFLAGLGRRPVVTGRILRRMPQQRVAPSRVAPRSVSSSTLVPTSLSGVRQSGDIEGLLPKELCLLLNSSTGESSNRRRRLLFSAKMLQNQLFSYEKSGFAEQYSLPDRSRRHLKRLPTDRGGPVILCLDTSYSMTGFRETLAKAVVLQSSIVASRDGRECYIIAFSSSSSGGARSGRAPSAKSVAECLVPLQLDDVGLTRLLAFLSKSFKGGTDVTEPLHRAIELMESNPAFCNADIVLVTDGELPNPPIAPSLLNRLRQMELQTGLEVHGLLIGRNSSVPLEALCTSFDGAGRVHDFLCKLDPILNMFAIKQQQLLQDQQDQQDQQQQAADIDLESFYTASSLKRSMQLSSSRASRGGSGRVPRLPTRLFMCSGSEEGSGLDELLQAARSEATELVESRFTSLLQAYICSDDDKIYASLQGVLVELSAGLIERELEAQLLLLAALSREHLLLFGAPGTGKSELGRRLSRLATTGPTAYFERLLTKFTQPEELFGPLSLRALEEDRYVRATGGYLPSAQVVFLDEIFKSSSSILNSLLTLLNERKFSNGAVLEAVPLITCIGASNEFPDSEELDALFDRFLLRRCVSPVSDESISDLIALAGRPPSPAGGALLADETLRAVYVLAQDVAVPAEVAELVKKVRVFLREECDTAVSDRRLLKAVGALKVSAAANGRKAVSLLDCLLLQHIFWSKSEDRERIEMFLWDNIVTDNRSIKFLLTNTLQTLRSDSSQEGRQVARSGLAPVRDVLAKKMATLRALRAEIRYDAPIAAAAAASSSSTSSSFFNVGFRRHLFLGDAEVSVLRQRITARVGSALRDLQASLETAVAVDRCIAAAGTAQGAAAAAQEEEAFRDRLEKLLRLCDDSVQGGLQGGNRSEESEEGEAFLASASGLTALELALSSKEAKRKLSPDEFKAWKKAQKARTGGLEKRGARVYNSNNVNGDIDD